MVNVKCPTCNNDLSFNLETCEEKEPCCYCGEDVETGVSDSDE